MGTTKSGGKCQAVADRRAAAKTAAKGPAVVVVAIGSRHDVNDLNGDPVAGVDVLDHKRASPSRAPHVGYLRHHSGPQLAVPAAGRLDNHGLAQLQRAPDFGPLRVVGAFVVGLSSEGTHLVCLSVGDTEITMLPAILAKE